MLGRASRAFGSTLTTLGRTMGWTIRGLGMSEAPQGDIEDIEVCARDGRRPRDAGPYRVMVGDALLRFRPLVTDTAVHTGRSLRELAALSPPEAHVVFAVLTNGLLEEIRLEESIDLREGIEKLLAFNNDRIFRFTLNGSDLQWGGAFITGATLLGLAKVDPVAHAAWLEDPDGSRRRIEASQLVDLSQPGVEAFVIEPLDSPTH
jgi:hypothetical protein